MFHQQESLKGVAMVVAASILWGTTGTAASFAPAVSALAIGAFAMGASGLLMVLSSLRLLLKDASRLRHRYGVLLLGSGAVALYPLAFYSAMRLSGVAVGTVIAIASAPLFAAILECLINRKKVTPIWVFCFVTGVAGIVLIAAGKAPSPVGESSIQRYAGVGLGLVAGLTYAVYSWAARRMIEHNIHARSAMAAMFGVAALGLLPSLAITGGNLFGNATHAGVAIYMALVPMFIGYLCFSYGLRSVDASQATLITLLEPVVAVVLAVVVVGERFLSVGWAGVALVVISLLMQLRPSRPVV